MQITKGRKTEPDALETCYDEEGYLNGVAPAIDLCSELDQIEEVIRERLEAKEPFGDIVTEILESHRLDAFKELLIKMLTIIGDSDSPKLELAVMVSAAGIQIVSEPDSAIAKKFSLSRQAYSVRVRNMRKRLGLTRRPRHLKSESAVESYRNNNRRNY